MKEFAMMAATQRLTQYFSREFGRLDAEVKDLNDPAVQEERSIRIGEVNELSDTLNVLFGTLTGSPGSKLFPSYGEHKSEVKETGWLQAAASVDLQEREIVISENNPDHENAKQDRFSITSEVIASLSPAQQRADQILQEYSETARRDITRYLPEYDRPFEMLPGTSAEGVPLGGNATEVENEQISVEQTGEKLHRGTDIPIDEYLTRSSNQLVEGLIDEDILKLRTGYNEVVQDVVVE
ncbi:hypothetical protein [Paenibacillus sp. Y412MC10]|uniref:hypothetical protein n=1 Tax=Geobacillus sp. (strain Y412MC10) TaxID=481743 RepID=UPI0011A92558|nr:hypothetical protein [Paenibacillus sp. Y412MC10]